MRRGALLIVFGAACAALIGCVWYLNPQCNDLIHNGDETDVDCGGTCGKCELGKGCSIDADCDNGYCPAGVCLPLPCANGVKDQNETDIDCGGGTCRKCAGARACLVDNDCFSGHCDRAGDVAAGQGQCRSLRTVAFADPESYLSGS